MLFDPALPARSASLRRWLKRLCLAAFLAVGFAAALLLFAPLI